MIKKPLVVYWRKSSDHLPSSCEASTLEEAKKIREEKWQAGFLVDIRVM